MRSTPQPVPLGIRRILDHGRTFHGTSEIVTAVSGGVRRATYSEISRNAARLANALRDLGVRVGDRVATYQWNNQEHVEAYFAVPCMGAVLHPLNVRLFPEQINDVANHVEDKVVIVDHTLIEAFAKLLPQLTTVEHVIVNGDADVSLLYGAGVGVHSYQQLLADQPDTYDWPDMDEDDPAAMCYTSGATGNRKDVVYSHRSIYQHSFGIALPDYVGLGPRDRILMLVPQFQGLGWGLPYAAFLTGASLAMPDQLLTSAQIAEFIAIAAPNKGVGVPTVWQSLQRHLEQHPEADISSLHEAIIGGSTSSPSLMASYAGLGVDILHVWGMTEISPLGTVARPPADTDDPWRCRLTEDQPDNPPEPALPHNGAWRISYYGEGEFPGDAWLSSLTLENKLPEQWAFDVVTAS